MSLFASEFQRTPSPKGPQEPSPIEPNTAAARSYLAPSGPYDHAQRVNSVTMKRLCRELRVSASTKLLYPFDRACHARAIELARELRTRGANNCHRAPRVDRWWNAAPKLCTSDIWSVLVLTVRVCRAFVCILGPVALVRPWVFWRTRLRFAIWGKDRGSSGFSFHRFDWSDASDRFYEHLIAVR